ncbi:MAG: DUF4474 domain-containing protein [Lachnospiraceae bacterium]|mgnify:FL=1|nr:DUF4474 domain-containing protein [Lachnospiraceae bacterium]
MYLFFTIFFVFLLFFVCFNFWRRKKIIKKICSMCMKEKCHLLDELIKPFGYSYVLSQDIFTSRIDAWQRDFGYCALFDKAALHFNMVFDCLPVYFPYRNKTWMIEFWKGQYGINTGCEIGVYHADRILTEEELEQTLFQCADDRDMLKMSLTLLKNDGIIASLCEKHWWLTAFSMGNFSNPRELSLQASIVFPTNEMAAAFTNGLMRAGYRPEEIQHCCNRVSFIFSASVQSHGIFKRLRIRIAQWSNHFWCRVFLFVTRPFHLSIDRILYLYYYLPFAFRKMLRIKKYKRKKNPRRNGGFV